MELKNCPFCGGEAEIKRFGTGRYSTLIGCVECSCELESNETFNHGTDWNTRTPPPSACKASPSGCKSESVEKVIAAAIDYRDNEHSTDGHHPDESCCALCDLVGALAAYQKESE